MKLGLEIAGLLAGGGRSALDEGGLEPRRSPRLCEGRLLRIRVDRRLPWAFSPRGSVSGGGFFDRLKNRHDAQWMVELTEVANYFAFLSGMVNPFEVPAPPDGDKLPG